MVGLSSPKLCKFYLLFNKIAEFKENVKIYMIKYFGRELCYFFNLWHLSVPLSKLVYEWSMDVHD